MDLEKEAWEKWYWSYFPFRETERDLEPFANLPLNQPWLKRIREANFLSGNKLAKKLNISSAAYHGYELREENGNLRLKTLRECAEALDCDFIYVIRPRKTISTRIWDQARAALKDRKDIDEDRYGALRLAYFVQNKMRELKCPKRRKPPDPKFTEELIRITQENRRKHEANEGRSGVGGVINGTPINNAPSNLNSEEDTPKIS